MAHPAAHVPVDTPDQIPGWPGPAQPDAGWFESEYNNRARVPESAEYLERWAEASARTRARMAMQADLAYGPDAAERLDVFTPLAEGAPILVFLHGGYWRALDKSDHSFIAPAFVKAGAAVVVPNYALCPRVTIGTIALQCAQALAWCWREAAGFGGDRSRIVVVGHSAGGHLAAMLAACDWPRLSPDLPPGLLSASVVLSGLFDLQPIRHTPSLQADLRLSAEQARLWSPVHWPAPRGPVSLFVGAQESASYHGQGDALQAAWGATVVTGHQRLPGHHHFSVLTDLVDPAGQSHAAVCRALGLSRPG